MKHQAKKVKRIERATILEIVNSENFDGHVSTMDQAEMAIPSYLHPNPFIREILWRRYEKVYKLSPLKPDMTVCEFGCGIGAFLPTLSEASEKVYAVDLFPQYAQALTKKLDLDISFAEDMSQIPDSSLDIIFAVEVMEHLDDPDDAHRIPVRAMIVFVNEDVELNADDSPVPAFYRKRVKDWLRGPGGLRPLPADLRDKLLIALDVADEGQDDSSEED